MTRPALRRTATGLAHDRLARSGRGLASLGLALGAVFAATGCDNPACVFSPTQCQPDEGGGGPGGIGSFSAIFPNDASWITPSMPTVVRFAPSIVDAHPETPLIVEFDQSLDPASLSGAFEVLESLTLTPVPLLDPPALVGDGRVVVLTFPSVGQNSPLIEGSTYLVRFTDDQEISDVTGQAFDFGTDQDIFGCSRSCWQPAPSLRWSTAWGCRSAPTARAPTSATASSTSTRAWRVISRSSPVAQSRSRRSSSTRPVGSTSAGSSTTRTSTSPAAAPSSAGGTGWRRRPWSSTTVASRRRPCRPERSTSRSGTACGRRSGTSRLRP